MNIKETIRAEIERRINISREKFLHLEEGPSKDFHEGRAAGLCGILAFLDTLEAEEKEEDAPDEVARFAFYRHNDDPKTLYLANVFVKENDRGKGYGNNILTMAEAAARSIGAWCIILKAKKGRDAMAWYARHGFTQIEEVGEFVWMRKSISEEKEVDLDGPTIAEEIRRLGPNPSEYDVALHFAEWGANHAVAPHYFKLRELKTGRVFLAEWSDIAGEWYERGNGKAYQSDEVEIIPRDRKTPTP